MKKSLIPDVWFDRLKWVAMFFLPALSVLVKTIFTAWQIPYADQISTTIMALDAFLSAILGISSIVYYKGSGQDDES